MSKKHLTNNDLSDGEWHARKLLAWNQIISFTQKCQIFGGNNIFLEEDWMTNFIFVTNHNQQTSTGGPKFLTCV